MTGFSVCQQLGITIGMSTTAAILQGRLRALLVGQLGSGRRTGRVCCLVEGCGGEWTWLICVQVVEKVISDIGYIRSLTGSLRSAVLDAYVGGFSYTYSMISQAQRFITDI